MIVQPDAYAAPRVCLHKSDGRPVIAIVELAARVSLHVRSAGQARALAAAFTEAARLLETCPECGGLLPGHVLTCPRIPAGPEHDAGSDA